MELPIMKLSQDDLDYHRAVHEQVKTVEFLSQFWAAHISNKYKLTPQDKLSWDGSIERVIQEST